MPGVSEFLFELSSLSRAFFTATCFARCCVAVLGSDQEIFQHHTWGARSRRVVVCR
jgi:hypothetical protein